MRVKNVLGERRRGDDDEVSVTHFEQEDVAILLGQLGECKRIKVITNMKPIAEDGQCERTRGHVKLGMRELEDGITKNKDKQNR